MSDYDYPVLSYEIGDGDSYKLVVETRPAWSAFRFTFPATMAKINVRLDGWDTPEKRNVPGHIVSQFEKDAAAAASAAAHDWLQLALDDSTGLRVTTEKDPEMYNRWLGRVYDSRGDLGPYLAGLHLAVPYHGKAGEKRWRDVYDLPGRAS